MTALIFKNQLNMPYNQDIEHALISFASTFQPYNKQPLTKISQFSNGIVFARLLTTVQNFSLEMTELNEKSSKSIDKLANLQKILQKIEIYMGDRGKSIKREDIELTQIAKNDTSDHILRFFELVIAVFMQSPHKDQYIKTIMQLDQVSQHSLVGIFQNAIDKRLDEQNDGKLKVKLIQHIQQLQKENQLLKEEIQELTTNSDKYKQQVIELRERLEEIQDAEEKNKPQSIDARIEQLKTQNDQLKSMNENLKRKLLITVREHEEDISRVREENLFLQGKLIRFQQYQKVIQHLNDQLTQAQKERDRALEQQREKRRLSRLLQEKQTMITKLKQKLEEVSEKNYTMQEHELYMKMQLEKKEVRFKQLEKQVKSGLNAELMQNNSFVIHHAPVHTTINEEEIDFMQEELEKLRSNHRQLERENMKIKKKLQKVPSLEMEKKKLQKIILDVSKSKDSQIEMLIASLYDLRTENIKMHQIIKERT